MKHIVVDARIFGTKNTGIGRYTKNLLFHISKLPNFSKYKFTLLVDSRCIRDIKASLGNSYNYHPVNIPHYSFLEQILLPLVLYKLQPDIVHFTHFNKPVFYFGKSIVTIHDLIKHFFHGKNTTTRTTFFHYLKYISYLVVSGCAIRSSKIIVPSNFWRRYLIKKYHKLESDIRTIYEAVDDKFLGLAQKHHKPKKFIVYTGNFYPHKNISIIFEAMKKNPWLNLTIVGDTNTLFYKKLSKKISNLKLKDRVNFVGHVSDDVLIKIYSDALCLVHPSYMEGFSLTGLEAMACNCPVISSNSSCLPEIYKNYVLYFDPDSSSQLSSAIQFLNKYPIIRQRIIQNGHKLVSLYSWEKTAIQTLDFYQDQL